MDMKKKGINFCVWKNLHERQDILDGKTDVDIYIAEASIDKFKKYCIELGAVEITSRFVTFDGISHYLFKGSENKLLHFHVYFSLYSGESHLKDFLIPIGSSIIENCINDNELGYIIAPSDENLLLIIRYYLKCSSIIGLMLYWRERADYLLQNDRLDLKSGMPAFLDIVNIEELESLAKHLSQKNYFMTYIWGKMLRHRLSKFRKYSIHRALILSYYNLIKFALNKLIFREKKSFLSRGTFLAITGTDGSGKSSLIQEINNIFSKKITVKLVQFGRPPSNALTFLLHVALWVRRVVTFSLNVNAKQPTVAHDTSGKTLLFALRSVALAYDRNKVGRRVLRYLDKGFLVIADRYPSSKVGAMDSPRLDPSFEQRKLHRYLGHLEHRLYQSIAQADLLIILKVREETAISRNRLRLKKFKESDHEIINRIRAFDKLSFSSSNQYIHDNNCTVEESTCILIDQVWLNLKYFRD